MNKTRLALTLVFSTALLAMIVFVLMSFDHRPISDDNDLATFQRLSSSDEAMLSLAHLPQTDVGWHNLDNNQFDLVEGMNWLRITLHKLPDNLAIRKSLHVQSMAVHLLSDGRFLPLPTLNINGLSVFQIPPSSPNKSQLFVQIHSKGRARLSANLLSNDNLFKTVSRQQLEKGFAIGGLLALAVTMLCVYVANNNRIILLLVGYLFSRASLLAVLLGFNLFYWFPNSPSFQGIELPILVPLSAIFLLWFCSVLFRTYREMSNFHRTMKITSWIFLGYMPISLLLPLDVNLILVKMIIVITEIMLVVLAFRLVKAQHRLARLFALVIGVQFIFNLMIIATSTWYEFNASLYTAAYWLNAFLITFLLSRQYQFQIKDKHAAQRLALDNERLSRKAKEALLALQIETQEQLESRVQERTLELNIALQELEEVNQELQKKNTLDELTGLYNRRHYNRKIAAELRRSRRNLTPLSLVVIDIDHFKSINDNFGHKVGDACLVQLATLIKQCLRRSADIGCRYGGEEFCLILPETEAKGAISLAQELREAVNEQALIVFEQTIKFTISCGVSTRQDQANNDADALFIAADKALYQAKSSGRNQVKFQTLTPLVNDKENNSEQ